MSDPPSDDEARQALWHRLRLEEQGNWNASRGSEKREIDPALVGEVQRAQKEPKRKLLLYVVCLVIVLAAAALLLLR